MTSLVGAGFGCRRLPDRKGLALQESIVSIIDILCGIYVLVMMLGLTTIVSWS